MKPAVRKAKMCKTKLSFRTMETALKVAAKHNQTVYECPVCFCFHCTSRKDWREEFVEIGKYNQLARELEESKEKLQRERKRLGDVIFNLNTIIKTKNEIIRNLQGAIDDTGQ